MLEIQCNPKIKAEHLARKAIVYLRQSSDKQASSRQQPTLRRRPKNPVWSSL